MTLEMINIHRELKAIFGYVLDYDNSLVILKKRLCEELEMINDELLEPDEMAWGKLTREECENGFLDIDHELHEEWGTKSFNILHFISALRGSLKIAPSKDDYDEWVDEVIGGGKPPSENC